MKHFFISYNSADRAWAEWIAWHLEDAGYATVIQAWDFRPGSNFVLDMHKAAAEAERTIAVLSPNYLASLFTQPEWGAAFAQDPTGDKGTLLPVRVRECELKGLLSPIVYIELLGLDEAAAKEALLAGVSRDRAKPKTAPKFPVTRGGRPTARPPRFPGALPEIWNVPHLRNPNFTGRETLLEDLRKALTAGHAAAVTQAISGLGGVGKTQLAVEHAYRFASDYDLVWWIRSEQAAALSSDFAGLAAPLSLPEKDAADQNAIIAAVQRHLGKISGWLLIFDNAVDPAGLRDYLPGAATGHVLITSRNPNWRGVAQPLSVKVWERAASVDFLLKRTGQKDEPAAAQRSTEQACRSLAEALGDLPLALEQAGAYIEETGCRIADYLTLFRSRRAELLKRRSASADYPDTVATTWDLSFSEVLKTAPAAVDLLNLFAFLAPDNILRDLFSHKDALTDSLKKAVEDGLMLDNAIAGLRRYSLLEATGEAFSVHRLVQAVVRDRLSDDEKKKWIEAAVRLVDAAFPFDSDDVRTWAECHKFLPHAFAAVAYSEAMNNVAAAETGRLLNQAGLYLKARAQFFEAKDLYERALKIGETVHGRDHPNIASGVNNIGEVLRALGDISGARRHFEQALKIDEAAYGPNHPTVASILNNLGGVLRALGDLSGARQHFEQALKIDEAAYGTNHPAVARDVNNLGGVLAALGDLSEARQHYERALIIDETTYGPNHPNVAIRVNNLGEVLTTQGDFLGARRHFERALSIDEAANGPNHPDVARDANNLGVVLQGLGDLSGARLYVERALKIDETIFGKNHPTVAIYVNNLGLVLAAQGDLSGARQHFERALKIFMAFVGENHPDTRTVRENLESLNKR